MPQRPDNSTTSQHDVTLNETALSQAHLQSLTRSWMSSALGDTADSAGEDADDDLLKFNSDDLQNDIAGIGFVAHKDSTGFTPAGTKSSQATEQLRKQLLGKKARGVVHANTNRGGQIGLTASKPRPGSSFTKRRGSDDDEEEETKGRSGLGKKKTNARPAAANTESQIKPTNGVEAELTAIPAIAPTGNTPTTSVKSQKRGTSYLDQLLADRATKKKKKNANTDRDR